RRRRSPRGSAGRGGPAARRARRGQPRAARAPAGPGPAERRLRPVPVDALTVRRRRRRAPCRSARRALAPEPHVHPTRGGRWRLAPLQCDPRRLAHALGRGERVRLAGFHREPWDFLAEADVFVLASDFEGFGNVLVEALAAGLPVVATDAPYGPRFILDHGRFGRLVPPGDVGALAAGIRDALRRPISEPDARRRWAERFAPANVAP